MTEPDGPAAPRPSSPTPEEISARLEALLKRTHALRAQQAPTSPGGPLTVTWPPPERELDRYDVVDVPEECPVKAAAESETQSLPPPTGPAVATSVAPVVVTTPEISKVAWNEPGLLATAEPSRPAPWTWLLTLALAVATVGQAGYIWYLKTALPAAEPGRIRVDAPEGADVRIGGRSIGTAPVEHTLEAGDYDVELIHAGQVVRADRVIVGPARTVVLLAPASREARPGGGGTSVAAGASPGQGAAPRLPVPASAEFVSATTGAVTIESTPPGLAVTMGGRPRGVTPLTLGKIAPGRHDVLVGTATRQVDVKAGEVATLRVPR